MNKSFSIIALLCALLVGAGVGFGISNTKSSGSTDNSDKGSNANQDKGEPLYWVAPMDDSYRRDKPGKSPMGMDLVPVYATEGEPGDVRIDPRVEQNLGLKLGEVTRGDFSTPISAVGYVAVNQDQLLHLHVRATGWVFDVSVATEGDPVKAGQKLFEFYSPEIINIQREYLQGVDSNQPNRARSSLLQLRAKGVSEREIERLQKTREVRERLHYYAHNDGYVVNLGVREGNFVDLPQNLMSIGSLDDVWVNIEVFEGQAALVEEGQEVTLTSDAYPGETWHGTVAYVHPMLNGNNRTLRARLIFPNRDGKLKPEMFVRAQVKARQRTDVLTAPYSAIIPTGRGKRVVRQVEPGVYRSVLVKTGAVAGDRVEILDGLREGDQVVVDGQFLIDSESSREADLSRFESREGGDDHDQDHGGHH